MLSPQALQEFWARKQKHLRESQTPSPPRLQTRPVLLQHRESLIIVTAARDRVTQPGSIFLFPF